MAKSQMRGYVLQHLRAWRLSRYLTQHELAAAAHVTGYTVSRAENGNITSRGTVFQLAAALGITPDQLRHEAPEKVEA